MNYQGVIIEESLADRTVLDDLKIVRTNVEQVAEGHKTPWLKQWTLHTVEIPEDQIDTVVQKISHSFDNDHSDWYADFKNDQYHYVVFTNNFFKVNPKNIEEYRPIVKYGLSLGIPIYQLDFSPEVLQWQR